MKELAESLLEFVRRTSTELPEDVVRKLKSHHLLEKKGSRAEYCLNIIEKNIKLAKEKSQPICQDTGSILFFIKAPMNFDEREFRSAACSAVAKATEKGYLRQNSVDPVTGKNTGNNLGPGFPIFHFEQHDSYDEKHVDVRLILKGGGCENVGAQYSLPDRAIGAERSLDGAKRCILNAVIEAQGRGCAPGILGVCIGGDRPEGYLQSKKQLLRKLDDKNGDERLAKLEEEIVWISNELGIGPMGFGGVTTVLGCKISLLNRLPASYFVSVTYMCWADRRQGVILNEEGKIMKWLY